MIGFVGTTDLARARNFYEGTLGLRFVEETAYACVFDIRGTMLRVIAVPAVEPAGYTVLGWRVDDIVGEIRRLREAGVVFGRFDEIPQDEDGVWTTPGGDKVAWFTDPDANLVSLTEFVDRG